VYLAANRGEAYQQHLPQATRGARRARRPGRSGPPAEVRVEEAGIVAPCSVGLALVSVGSYSSTAIRQTPRTALSNRSRINSFVLVLMSINRLVPPLPCSGGDSRA
jgi:hypothetical protein